MGRKVGQKNSASIEWELIQQDPERMARRQAQQREAKRAQAADPERRAKLRAEQSARHKERWETDPEYREAKRVQARERGRKLKEQFPEAWRELNKAKSLQHVCKRFGISVDDYERMQNAQSGLCAICGLAETTVLRHQVCRLSIDHCHKTGAVRELLCNRCNRVIGFVDDNIEILEKAIAYLKKHNSESDAANPGWMVP